MVGLLIIDSVDENIESCELLWEILSKVSNVVGTETSVRGSLLKKAADGVGSLLEALEDVAP